MNKFDAFGEDRELLGRDEGCPPAPAVAAPAEGKPNQVPQFCPCCGMASHITKRELPEHLKNSAHCQICGRSDNTHRPTGRSADDTHDFLPYPNKIRHAESSLRKKAHERSTQLERDFGMDIPASTPPPAATAKENAAYRKRYGALSGTEISEIERAGLSLELVELLEERCRNLEEDNEHLKNLLRVDPEETIEDGFGSVWSRTCPTCGLGTMHVSRPGKVQCDYCE